MEMTFLWAVVACFSGAVLSAIVPWFAVELIVIALPAMAKTPMELAGLVLIATIGQMAGKCVVYWAARRTTPRDNSRTAATMDRWRHRFMSRPHHAAGVVLFSSLVGLPPFYAVTILAGVMKMGFPTFIAAGAAGRLLRFGGIVAIMVR
jgi:membrane protein YqaA with SNARE-associated domain